jgi:hypothetical protein
VNDAIEQARELLREIAESKQDTLLADRVEHVRHVLEGTRDKLLEGRRRAHALHAYRFTPASMIPDDVRDDPFFKELDGIDEGGAGRFFGRLAQALDEALGTPKPLDAARAYVTSEPQRRLLQECVRWRGIGPDTEGVVGCQGAPFRNVRGVLERRGLIDDAAVPTSLGYEVARHLGLSPGRKR